jgi:hypothetical protein
MWQIRFGKKFQQAELGGSKGQRRTAQTDLAAGDCKPVTVIRARQFLGTLRPNVEAYCFLLA